MATLAELLRQGADKLINLPSEAQRFVTNPQAFTQLLTGKNPLPRETGFAAGATGLPPTEMSVLDPNQAAYMQGYTEGEPIGYAGMAAPFAAPAAVATGKALAPKLGQVTENYMVRQGMIQPLTAYHGTPHTIQGQFDINKVGTGEGAQAYGHGMYFAENPSVAKEYQRKLSGGLGNPSNELMLNGQPLTDLTDSQRRAYEIVARDGRKNALGTAKDLESQGFDASHIRDALKATKGQEISLTKNEGNIYKVDIPDQDISNMLSWDLPLSQQPAILEKLKSLGEAELNKLGINPDFTRRSTGKELTGESLYDVLTTSNSQKGASNLLAKQGITGIRYLDEGSRGKPYSVAISTKKGPYAESEFSTKEQAEQYIKEKQAEGFKTELKNIGTSNFVVFEPSTVKILEKNNKPVTRKELIQQQIDKIE